MTTWMRKLFFKDKKQPEAG